MGCLYMLTSPSGKSYIGLSKRTAPERFANHLKHVGLGRRNAIHRAILKYGPETFRVRTLVIADDLEYLKLIEPLAIRAYSTFCPNGYNMTHGGEGSAFWAPESLVKAKIGQRAAWQRNYEQRKNASKPAIAAMRRACEDVEIETRRRRSISTTMKSRGIGKSATNGAAKLTRESVLRIREMLRTGLTQTGIAKSFGVSRRLIGFINTGHRWGHV